MKCIGRPEKANKLEKQVKFFVTPKDYLIIQGKAAAAGQTIAECMRQVALTGQLKSMWTPEERDLFCQTVEIADDVDSLVQAARTEGALYAMLHFEKYRAHIDDVISRLEGAP